MKNLLLLLLLPLSLCSQNSTDISNLPLKKEIDNIFAYHKYYPYFPRPRAVPGTANFYNISSHQINFMNTSFESDSSFHLGDSVVYGGIIFSSNNKKLLLEKNTQSIYRRSYSAQYDVLHVPSRKSYSLNNGSGEILFPEFSPNGNYIAYLYKNNIYVDSAGISFSITSDGTRNEIINGLADWVHEEEFRLTKAFAWSTDEKRICYLKFDESQVRSYTMPYYDSIYPTIFTFKYPKVGEVNSKIWICVYNLETKETKKFQLPEEYVYTIGWSKIASQFYVQTANRFQDTLKTYSIDAWSLNSSVILEETSDSYVEYSNYFNYALRDTFYYISEKSGWSHLYLKPTYGGETQLTEGNWDVTSVYGYSEYDSCIYFLSSATGSLNRVVQRVNIYNKEIQTLTPVNKYSRAIFSGDFSKFVCLESSGDSVTSFALYSNKGELLSRLKPNVSQEYYKRNIQRNFQEIELATGEKIRTCIISKKGAKVKKGPVLVSIYGGPGYQTVENSWNYYDFWYNIFLEKGWTVIEVDPRGSFGYGTNYKKQTYKQLGKLETEDFIFAANYYSKEKWFDSERVNIFGWSYGGYMSLLSITAEKTPYTSAVSVAPITDWRYYDNAYTERYMQTPETNPEGYNISNAETYVENLQGNLLLMHGMFDDNVHPQHSYSYINKAIAKDKDFDVFVIPNHNHSMNDSYTRAFVYYKITSWLIEKNQ